MKKEKIDVEKVLANVKKEALRLSHNWYPEKEEKVRASIKRFYRIKQHD